MAVKHGPCLLTLKKRVQAFETKCLKKLLHISYLGHKTNDQMWSKINSLVGPQKPLLTTVKRQKLAWFRHGAGYNSLSKTILQYLGRWATPWLAEEMLDWHHQRMDIPAYARPAHKGLLQKRLVYAESSLMSPRRPNQSRD